MVSDIYAIAFTRSGRACKFLPSLFDTECLLCIFSIWKEKYLKEPARRYLALEQRLKRYAKEYEWILEKMPATVLEGVSVTPDDTSFDYIICGYAFVRTVLDRHSVAKLRPSGEVHRAQSSQAASQKHPMYPS